MKFEKTSGFSIFANLLQAKIDCLFRCLIRWIPWSRGRKSVCDYYFFLLFDFQSDSYRLQWHQLSQQQQQPPKELQFQIDLARMAHSPIQCFAHFMAGLENDIIGEQNSEMPIVYAGNPIPVEVCIGPNTNSPKKAHQGQILRNLTKKTRQIWKFWKNSQKIIEKLLQEI